MKFHINNMDIYITEMTKCCKYYVHYQPLKLLSLTQKNKLCLPARLVLYKHLTKILENCIHLLMLEFSLFPESYEVWRILGQILLDLFVFVKDTRAGFGVNSIFLPFYNSIIKLSVAQDATFSA